MNNKGVSFVEALLTVVILFTICGTLIPLSYNMKSTLYNEKLELYASQTAFEAAKLIQSQNATKGMNQIESVDFYWHYDGMKICVEYINLDGTKITCIEPNEVTT